MISTDFAANESWDDAILSLKLLSQPWKWRSGNEIKEAKTFITQHFALNKNQAINFFLSGRSALYFLLKSLNLPKGSEVVVQAFTCEAVVLPIIELGLNPVYIDIEPETYSMEVNNLTSKLGNQATSKLRVLILQHTFGLIPKNREKILKLAKDKKIIVIEDLAHGFSTGEILNTEHYYLLSFGRSKMLSSVFGGAVVSQNKATNKLNNQLTYPAYGFIISCLLYKLLTMLIKSTYDLGVGKILHKVLNKLNLLVPEITNKEKNGNYDKLFNFAYPNALAALLYHQLNKLEQVNAQRARISKIYNRTISKKGQKTLINNWSMIRFPLLINNRENVIKKIREKNIFLGKWYDQVVAPKEIELDSVGYKAGTCPVAEEICKKIINLPTNIPANQAQLLASYLNDVT